MDKLTRLVLVAAVLMTANVSFAAESKCDKAAKKLAKHLKDNGKKIDRCAAANAVGIDYPECLGLAKKVVELEQSMKEACADAE